MTGCQRWRGLCPAPDCPTNSIADLDDLERLLMSQMRQSPDLSQCLNQVYFNLLIEKSNNKRFFNKELYLELWACIIVQPAVHIDKPVGLVVRVLSRPWSRLEKVPGGVSTV